VWPLEQYQQPSRRARALPDSVHLRPENIFINLTRFPSNTSPDRPRPAPRLSHRPSVIMNAGSSNAGSCRANRAENRKAG
jgi:hypothetical protein